MRHRAVNLQPRHTSTNLSPVYSTFAQLSSSHFFGAFKLFIYLFLRIFPVTIDSFCIRNSKLFHNKSVGFSFSKKTPNLQNKVSIRRSSHNGSPFLLCHSYIVRHNILPYRLFCKEGSTPLAPPSNALHLRAVHIHHSPLFLSAFPAKSIRRLRVRPDVPIH